MRGKLTELNQSMVRMHDRLSHIEQKLEAVEKSLFVLDLEVKDTKKELKVIESKTGKLECVFSLIKEEVAHLSEDVDEVQAVVENSGNLGKKNNLRLRGLKEQTEEGDLCTFLQDLFTSWLGADQNVEMNLGTAYRVGPLKKYHYRNPRGLLIKFPNWHMKSKVEDAFQENPDFLINDSRISLLPDLSIITLSKHQNFKFLTSVLQQEDNWLMTI